MDRDAGVIGIANAEIAADAVPAVPDAVPTVADAAPTSTPTAPLTFEVADVYDLPYDDGEFDVVHAHQVLQHLSDPVAALIEMSRVTRPGGLVAVRDSDYAAIAWYPPSLGLDTWRRVYRTVARANGAEPDAGRHLLAWAHAAGFADVTPSSSTWCFATPSDREWWGNLWADRTAETAFGRQAIDLGLTSQARLEVVAEAWRNWAADEDGWIVIVHGEILIRVPERPFRGGIAPSAKWWSQRGELLAGVGAGGPTPGSAPGHSNPVGGQRDEVNG
jgi:SAM-dependent methyltransferase